MTEKVLLKIRATQEIDGEEPEVMELQTEGTLQTFRDRTELSYAETEMTGLEGVTTSFVLYGKERIVLRRTGDKLSNEMCFMLGEKHNSLYEMEFGTLLLTVEARRMELHPESGWFEVEYDVAVEHSMMGVNTYRVEFFPKK